MKFWMISVTLLMTLSCCSQVDWNIFAGPQALSTKYTVNGIKQKNNTKIGFQAGVGLKVPFEGNLYFAPAAFYSMKGYKVTYTQYAFPPDVDAKDNNTTIHTFELAALLQYDFNTQPGHFFIKVGPSLDFQLFGHETYNLKSGGSVDHNMKFSFTDYGHFSANILGQFGYETSSGLIIFAQYNFGLASINNADYGPEIRHRVYGISIGKFLSHKK
jgi:Outer membrane protein beta-barrel domain